MAVYNDEQHIYRSVLSVLNQTMRDFEFIVVDDCSTDQTPAILAQLAREDSRLRVFRNDKNIERSRSRNRAIIEEAKTPYIMIVDSDDVSMPDRLERQLAAMQADSTLAAVGGQYHHVTPEGEILAGSRLPTGETAIRNALRRRNPVWTAAAMLRKDVFDALGGYDTRLIYAEDYDLTWRLSLNGRIDNLNDVVMLVNWDWRKERRVFYSRRLNHMKIRLKWLRTVGFKPQDLGAAVFYLASGLIPPQIGQIYQKRRYSQPAPADFVVRAQQWLHTLNEQEQRLRAAS
jgi:glycosyltransferase involved in cell wall biosynthesis